MRIGPITLALAFVLLIAYSTIEHSPVAGQGPATPSSGPIHGRVTFRDGPNKGENVTGAEVVLYNRSGGEIGRIAVNQTGLFSFDGIPLNDEYELRVTPPDEITGLINERTGYLFWDGSGFAHPLRDNESYYNVSLAYYLHTSSPVQHPKVSIRDENGQPVEGALVEAEVPGIGVHTDVTDRFGIAVFTSFDLASFPNGTLFKASRDGFKGIEWAQGDEAPEMERDEREDDILLVSVLLIVIIAILLLALGLILSKGPGVEEERSKVIRTHHKSNGRP